MLRFLGYQFIPEKCEVDLFHSVNDLTLILSTPYGIDIKTFLNDLKNFARNKSSTIRVDQHDAGPIDSCKSVRLLISYSLIETNQKKIFQRIDEILSDQNKINFYHHSHSYIQEYKVGLTITQMEELVKKKMSPHFHLDANDVWIAFIKKNAKTHTKIRFLEKKVLADSINFPKITLVYEEAGNIKQIDLTRDQIFETLESSNFDEFLINNIQQKEFVPPNGIHDFFFKNYNHNFEVTQQGNYKINFGYHSWVKKILEKYGIKELSSYVPDGWAISEQTCYYLYDKKDYVKLLIAVKEIKGEACLEERWNQLTYYINNQMWEKLNEELKFLLNLKTELGPDIDYTPLLTRLHGYVKETFKNCRNNRRKNSRSKIF